MSDTLLDSRYCCLCGERLPIEGTWPPVCPGCATDIVWSSADTSSGYLAQEFHDGAVVRKGVQVE